MTRHLRSVDPTPAPVGRVDSLRPATLAVRAGLQSDTQHGAVVPPLHLSSNFTFAGYGEQRPYDYTRSGNPTRDLLADALAELEKGVGAVVTSTGMSAIHLVLQLLRPGDLLLAPKDCYGGTYRLLDACHKRGAFTVDFIDPTNRVELRRALGQKPRMVWVESPSNPLLRITDIRRLCRSAARQAALVVVDNTFLSPVLQRPLELGADIVVHSTTKYLNGHSDVVGGAVISRDRQVHDELAWWANCLGITGAPFDSFLTLRGLRTLHPRMELHLRNAAALVELLERHEAVERVYYPGLPEHPDHAVAAAQQDGFGGMLSFELRTCPGGSEAQIVALLDGLRCFSLAESLGGVESLIAHPATMTHAAMAPEARQVAGIRDTLLRISAGIEAREDLVQDLRAGLDRALACSTGCTMVG